MRNMRIMRICGICGCGSCASMRIWCASMRISKNWRMANPSCHTAIFIVMLSRSKKYTLVNTRNPVYKSEKCGVFWHHREVIPVCSALPHIHIHTGAYQIPHVLRPLHFRHRIKGLLRPSTNADLCYLKFGNCLPKLQNWSVEVAKWPQRNPLRLLFQWRGWKSTLSPSFITFSER